MKSRFEIIPDRLASESIKWHYFAEDILPMWVADMDFLSSEPIIRALQERVNHGVFGYPGNLKGLTEAILNHLETRFDWKVQPSDLVFVPGVVVGFNTAVQALAEPGEGLLIQTPVYPPFFEAAPNGGLRDLQVKLGKDGHGRYQVDLPAFEAGLDQGAKAFLLCNPHNPVGRVFTRPELEKMAEACLSRGVKICSDEIHCDLIYSGHKHVPIASLDDEIAANTITFMAPSKTFNVPGLEFSFAVIQNPALRQQFKKARRGLVGHPNLMGIIAARAAYAESGEWLGELLDVLESNRDYLAQFIKDHLPGVKMFPPEGTYLAWLDFNDTPIAKDPCGFFVENAKVGLNDGKPFGKGGEGYARLNFGCTRSTLEEGLQRMAAAFQQVQDETRSY